MTRRDPSRSRVTAPRSEADERRYDDELPSIRQRRPFMFWAMVLALLAMVLSLVAVPLSLLLS